MADQVHYPLTVNTSSSSRPKTSTVQNVSSGSTILSSEDLKYLHARSEFETGLTLLIEEGKNSEIVSVVQGLADALRESGRNTAHKNLRMTTWASIIAMVITMGTVIWSSGAQSQRIEDQGRQIIDLREDLRRQQDQYNGDLKALREEIREAVKSRP